MPSENELRQAFSAIKGVSFFGLSQKIESINQAVIMLGLSKIKEIILSASLNVPLKFYDNQNPYTNQYQYLPPIQKPGTNPFFR